MIKLDPVVTLFRVSSDLMALRDATTDSDKRDHLKRLADDVLHLLGKFVKDNHAPQEAA